MLIFGGGWLGRAIGAEAVRRGGAVAATSRDADTRQALKAQGLTAIDPADAAALNAALAAADALVVTAPPTAEGCPGHAALAPLLAKAKQRPGWIGYVSSTAVYGDRAGGWAFEDDALNAATLQGARRVRAEQDWLETGRTLGLAVHLFRLPALYGPGRSGLDRLRNGEARMVRKPGQVFNRIHADDVVSGLFASMDRPNPGRAYNLVDDEPAPAHVVTAWSARHLGLPLPPEVDWTDPSVSEGMRRFYLDSKRVSNARAKAELGWRPKYPSYREGIEALIAAGH